MKRSCCSLAAFLAMLTCAAGLAGCSSHGSKTTTSTGARRSEVYRVGTTAIRIAFPGSADIERDPPALEALLPKHAIVTTWSVGDVGALKVHSYELVIATFPSGSPANAIDEFLSRYAGKPNSTMFGAPALREISTIPFSTGTRYSGITAFSAGRVLVEAVGFDSVRADVVAFLASLQLVSPHG